MHAWEIRKYDKVLENMFFIAFSKTQPNSRKYFAKYFQEHIQTFENNLLSKKYSSPENISCQTKHKDQPDNLNANNLASKLEVASSKLYS